MDLPSFSIQQELWHDIWLAATAAARSRKRQIDLDVRQRVERLLEDHGPGTSRPLTLRVYGTMMKGFAVINNERARVLCGDCERVVLMFAQVGEDSHLLKLPASKKKRVDALTLDLDLSKVQDCEAFDWTEAKLEKGSFLRLQAPEEQLLALPTTDSSLFEQVSMLDEAFPPEDAPASAPLDAASGALALAPADAAPPMEAAPVTPLAQELLPFSPATAPARPAKRRRAVRALAKSAAAPGHILGYDGDTLLQQDWQHEEDAMSICRRGVSEYVLQYQAQEPVMDHLGPLRALIDPCLEDLRIVTTRLGSSSSGAGQGTTGVAALPEVQALLAGEPAQAEILQALLGEPPEAVVGSAVAPDPAQLAASRPDPFHPYSPEVPLRGMQGAVAKLKALCSAPVEAEQAQDDLGRDLPYDPQTFKIGKVLHSCLESGSTEANDRAVTFDDILPTKSTDQVTAAKTFAAVLVLATAGKLSVMQPMPYGPIAMALA